MKNIRGLAKAGTTKNKYKALTYLKVIPRILYPKNLPKYKYMLIQFATITDMNVFYMKKRGTGFFIWKEDIVLLIYKYPFTEK